MLCYKHAALQMIKQGRGGRLIGTTVLLPFVLESDLTHPTLIQAPVQLEANKVLTFVARINAKS